LNLRIGCSGWSYQHWRDGFYRGVPQKRWLEHYAEHFDIELNCTTFWMKNRIMVSGIEIQRAEEARRVKFTRAVSPLGETKLRP
jgi:uncharacterized protein YecE (DUF72 family)